MGANCCGPTAWNRIFRVSDAQVALALKDSAGLLFKTQLETSGAIKTLDPAALAASAQYQTEQVLGGAVQVDPTPC